MFQTYFDDFVVFYRFSVIYIQIIVMYSEFVKTNRGVPSVEMYQELWKKLNRVNS